MVVGGDDDDENMRCFAYIYARVIYLFPKPYISAACFILKVLKVQFTSSGEISGTKKKTTHELSYFLRSVAGRSQKAATIPKNCAKPTSGEKAFSPKFGDVPKSKQVDRTPGLSATQVSPHELRQ